MHLREEIQNSDECCVWPLLHFQFRQSGWWPDMLEGLSWKSNSRTNIWATNFLLLFSILTSQNETERGHFVLSKEKGEWVYWAMDWTLSKLRGMLVEGKKKRGRFSKWETLCGLERFVFQGRDAWTWVRSATSKESTFKSSEAPGRSAGLSWRHIETKSAKRPVHFWRIRIKNDGRGVAKKEGKKKITSGSSNGWG